MNIELKIGYTTGVFDMFHIGHLNIFKKAKQYCDYLIVGVTTDELCASIKNKKPIIPFEERSEIVKSIEFVDEVVPQTIINEVADYKKYQFQIIFKGGDWKGSKKWIQLEESFGELGVQVKFLPYTEHTSSTKLRELIEQKLI